MTSLEEYRKKRDFKKTSEPPPVKVKSSKKQQLSFVIQKHDATRLHYDFRLEMDGVLKSWAVPKGPSLDPSDKRLAMQTEDHPLAYGGFEGTIPEGEYGAGPVILWDHGTYEAEGDPLAALERGRLTFTLHGEKLHGRFHLVRTRGDAKARARSADGESKAWLLIKATDDDVREGVGVDQLDARSVTTGRTIEDVALAPELCTPVKEPPEGDAWLHEPKIDGYRILAKKDGASVALLTRNGLDWTERFPAVAAAVKKLKPARAIVDGEIAVVDEKGAASFGALQRAVADADPGASTVYFAFDLLSLEGNDLRARPLSERKERLAEVLPAPSSSSSRKRVGAIERVPFVIGHGDAFLEEMKKQGLEGMVSKPSTRSTSASARVSGSSSACRRTKNSSSSASRPRRKATASARCSWPRTKASSAARSAPASRRRIARSSCSGSRRSPTRSPTSTRASRTRRGCGPSSSSRSSTKK